jgi:hypothetical protein
VGARQSLHADIHSTRLQQSRVAASGGRQMHGTLDFNGDFEYAAATAVLWKSCERAV